MDSTPQIAPVNDAEHVGYVLKAQSKLEQGKSAETVTTELTAQGIDGAAELVAEAEAATAKAAAAFNATQKAATYKHLDDIGNGERLVSLYGDRVRYVPEARTWLAWNGKAWAPKGAQGAVERCAKETALSIHDEAKRAQAAGDAAASKALSKHAHASSNRSRIEGMLYTARSEVEVAWDELDAHLWALNVENGIVDLRTGELRPHDPAELHSKMAAAAFYSDARAPKWERFLEEVLPDEEVRWWFQKAVGYSASGDVGEHVLPFPYGTGGNGKSAALAVIRTVLGDYAAEAAPELLHEKAQRGIPVDIMDLRGFRFVTTSEVKGGRLDAELTKRVVGEEVLKARAMRQNFETFRNVTHLWMVGNDRPLVDGTDEALWRRFRLLPFEVKVAPENVNTELPRELYEAERDGILAWIVRGATGYAKEKLRPIPAAVSTATDEYRQDSNPVREWFEANCQATPGRFVTSDKLHANYVEWCREDRYRGKPIGKRSPRWAEALRALGLQADRETIDGKQVRAWRGVWLLDGSGIEA